ncbi:MAG: PVC-type heme-binding CxxCH protein [Planctomycetota bacterium]
MTIRIPASIAFCIACTVMASAGGWQTTHHHRQFHAEGSSCGDIDGDGQVDLVAGPLWYRGPDFKASFEIAPARTFPIEVYSDQFSSQVADVNGDGASDVLVVGFPGKPARLYLNPGHEKLDRQWQVFEITAEVDNESPAITDLIPGGLPEIVCGNQSSYGYFAAGEDATKPWTFTAISRPKACAGRFAHGMGVGDVNGDGLPDVLDKTYWWQQPSDPGTEQPWTRHRWCEKPEGGGAQICVADVDGDGDSDIVSSLNAHGYGLAWFEQRNDHAKSESPNFVRHNIMGSSSQDNPFGVAFSQMHAVALEDVDGDGAKDIVTGKRWMAHRGKDVGGLQEPVLYWFRCVRSDSGVEFVPHKIDSDSGVGVDILVADMNADAKLDIVSCSKRGLSIHLQGDLKLNHAESRWQQTKGRDQSKYADGYSPQDAAKNTLVPSGFSVDLIASEPDLTQPIAICFDARGRIWVIEGHTYPQKAPEGKGRDRVLILEDTDADGSFDQKTVFIEGLNLASGIEVGFGGVWIGAAPELLFIPDAEHDGVPDGDPVVLLDGWGYQDTHETLNSFTWGPDGWLYGCHGVFTHSNVGKPGAGDDQRQRINAGVWRYHPTRHEFEVFAHGTSNPWGVDFNDRGDWFVSACVIPHLYHMVQGGRYQRQAGSHFNPYTFDDIKTIADHLHYVGDPRSARGYGRGKTVSSSAADTSVLGGGHAHCGLAIYNGDAFPSDFYGDLLFHNLHGHRVVREQVERNGSGYVGKHRPDFALAQDHKEVGVGIMVGPDGAIYTSDWHDVQTCHNRTVEVWDRTDGRLFRIRYGDFRPQRFNLWRESDDQLIARLSNDNGFMARQSSRVLQERAAARKLDVDRVGAAIAGRINSESLQRDRLRGMWTRWCIGAIDEDELITHLSDQDPVVRSWAVHFAGEEDGQAVSQRVHDRLVVLSQTDPSSVVRRRLSSLLQKLPLDQRWSIVDGLTSHAIDSHDHNIPSLVWFGLEPLIDQDADRVYEVARRSGWPNLLRFVVRRTANDPEGRQSLVSRLDDSGTNKDRVLILEEMLAVATSRGGADMPDRWPDVFQKLTNAPAPRVQQLTRSLAVQFGDQSVFPYFRKLLLDRSRPTTQRADALSALRKARDPDLPTLVLQLLDDSAINEQGIAALAQYSDPEIAGRLVANFAEFSEATKTSTLNTLVARASFADTLVKAMESKVIPASDVPAFIVRQAISLGDESLVNRLEQVWGRIATSDEDLTEQYAKYRALLTTKAISRANARHGRMLYEANCGKCHKLFGEGGDIGPNITGANRTKVDYWLENILEPNALIGRAYQMTSFLTADGRVINGVVQSENDDAVTVQTATEKVVLSHDDIEEALPSKSSLMPSGQMEPMSDQDVRDLFKYLMSPRQVPREGALKPTGQRGDLVEAETMQQIDVSAGRTSVQPMASFGDQWSGGHQLWWRGGHPKATMSSSVFAPRSGLLDVAIDLTQARDYATVRVTLGDQPAQEVDLYSPNVTLGDSLVWKAVPVTKGQSIPVKIEITGKNAAALPRYMVGIDAIRFLDNPGP